MEIVVVSPDDGYFKMAMNKPTNTSDYYKTDNIKANAPASELRSKINKFYTSQYGVSPIVTLKWFKSDGAETI